MAGIAENAPEVTPRMSAEGNSESWKKLKKNVVNIFDGNFLGKNPANRQEFGDSFHAMTLEDVIKPEMWESFAYFLMSEYEGGQSTANPGHLAYSTATNYLNMMINVAKQRFALQKSAASELFFSCTQEGSKTESARWLKGIRNNMVRKGFQRAVADGEILDNSAIPIGLTHLGQICSAFSKANTLEAAERRLALTVLFKSAGRGNETSWSSYSNMNWSVEHQCAFLTLVQMKTGKVKKVALCPGKERHFCFFSALAYYLTMQTGQLANSPVDQETFLLPFLKRGKETGGILGDYIRGVCHGGLKKYQKVWVTLEGFSSDRKPCAQGVRAGMCNLLGQYMPAEFVVFATGHDFEELSALYNYIDATEASMMPSAVVLAGYPAFPWGQNGTGPRPMSLRALEQVGVHVDGLVKRGGVMDQLFNLDSTRPEELCEGGSLRPMVKAAFASCLGWSEERMRTGDEALVSARLIALVGEESLVEWSRLIHDDFVLQNIHLTERKEHSVIDQAVTAIHNLGAAIGNIAKGLTTLDDRVVSSYEQLNKKLLSLEKNLQKLNARLDATDTSLGKRKASDVSVETGGSSTASVINPPSSSSSVPTLVFSSSSSIPGPDSGPPPGLQPPAQAPGGRILKQNLGLIRQVVVPTAGPGSGKLTGLKAIDVWKSNPTGLQSRADQSRSKMVIEWFDAMSTADEKLLFRPLAGTDPVAIPEGMDEAQYKVSVCKLLNSLSKKRIAAAYEAANADVPKKIKDKNHVLPVGFIEDLNKAFKAEDMKIHAVVVTKIAFQEFRNQQNTSDV